jgi:arylsulfatase A-like enzyme
MKLGRRTLISAGLLGAAGASLWAAFGRQKPRPRFDLRADATSKLNVLLIVSDQERDWSLTPPGFIERHCPARQWLLERGTRFTKAVTPTQFCSMARGVVYSGAHSQTNGVWENVPIPYASDMRRDIPTLGSLFADAGYITGYTGKWHLTRLGEGKSSKPAAEVNADIRSYGFDDTEVETETDGANIGMERDGETVRQALSFIHRHAKGDRPWFLPVNLLNPHDIMYYTANDAMTRSRVFDFPDRSVRPPTEGLYADDLGYEVFGPWGPGKLANKAPGAREYGACYEAAMGQMPYDDLNAAREFQNYYWNCIRDSDRHLMALLKGLEASGELDRTVILFTSDHGEYLGAFGLRGKGVTPYREASHVPFVIVHPNGRKGATAEDPVSLIDIGPTLLSMAGVGRDRLRGVAPGLTGVDVSAPVLTGTASPRAQTGVLMHWTSLAFQDRDTPGRLKDVLKMNMPWRVPALLNAMRQTDWSKRGQMRALYDGRYKFARYFAPDDYHRPTDWQTLSTRNDLELFDTATDPDETINLAGDAANRDLILSLNSRLNALSATEIGADDGGFLPFFVRL